MLTRVTSSSPGIWELTRPERMNAATLIASTTARPFIFMGHTFRCFYCQQYHFSVDTLLEHADSHQTPDKKTLLQKYITKNKRNLQADISELRCRICEEYCQNLDLARLHLIEKHDVKFLKAGNAVTGFNLTLKDGLFACHLCSERFHLFSLLNKHMNIHVGRVVCERCGAGFVNDRLLKKHTEVHTIDQIQCGECKKTFDKKSQLRYHMALVHKGHRRKEKTCPHCPFKYKEHSTKLVHLRDAHGIKFTFECHMCRDKFPSRRALTSHSTKFHSEKFKCDVCTKCFGMKHQLEQHMRMHSGERSFMCRFCKSSFMHRSTLVKHVKRLHGEDCGVIECLQCGKGFDKNLELKRHMEEWHSLVV